MNRILLVEHIHPAGEALLAEAGELVFPYPQNIDGILAAISDCDALVVRNTKITRSILELAPRLRVVGRHGVGYDTVDVAAASALGIPVVYTPAANTESVAEIAVAFILMLGRKILRAHVALRSGSLFSETTTLSVMAQQRGLANFDLWGKTLGIIGVGRIGSSVARKMIAAFNMRVLRLRSLPGSGDSGGLRSRKSRMPGRYAPPMRFRHPPLPGRSRNAPHDRRRPTGAF
jgi:D-3-phosphoglycerate dehydrogenase / 2-oxoglutarate reductase